MMEIVLSAAAGVCLGSIVGLLPGIGPALILLSILPLLDHFDLISLFVFYSALLSSSQYFGSVSAVVYGVAGEISSMPAVHHGHAMFLQGKGAEILAATSSASLLAALWGLFWMFVVYHNTDALTWFYDIKILVAIYLLIIIALIMTTQNRLMSLCLLILGLILGKVGFDSLHQIHFLVPTYTSLDGGLPFYALFCGFVIVPALWHYRTASRPESAVSTVPWISIGKRLRYLLMPSNKLSMIRGSLIGCIAGLIPGASYAISSNLADRLESRMKNDPESRLLAAEAANNSAAITVLLPLILFAVPIIPSEAIILGVAESKGFGYTISLDFIKNHLPLLMLALLGANMLTWCMAGVFYRYAIQIYDWMKYWIYPGMIAIVTLMVLYVASDERQLWLALMTYLVAMLVGFVIKHQDSKFVLIFAFFLSDSMLDNLYRFWLIYS